MDFPPRIESIPCPTCQALELRYREEGLGAECGACGQQVIFDEDTSDLGKRRNYTPERAIRRLAGEGGGTPLPPGTKAPARAPGEGGATALPPGPTLGGDTPEHRGPLPVVKSIGEMRAELAPSHAMEAVQRANWMKRLAVAGVLGILLAGTGYTIWQTRKNKAAAATAAAAPGPDSPVLVMAEDLPPDDPDAVEARAFLAEWILPAGGWEDWLPHVRQRERVEPLMRAFHAKHGFQSMAGARVGESKMVRNPAGRFAIFLLDSQHYPVAMVETGAAGPKLDWEMMVNFPFHEWTRFLAERPETPQELAVTLSRCYAREDYLLDSEKARRGQLLGLRFGMPGSEETLFAAVPMDGPIGQWALGAVPWEHEDKTMLVRAVLAYSPDFAKLGERVVLHGEPTSGWNKADPAPAAP